MKKVNKIKSRKLFVFIIWSVLGVVLFLTKHNLDIFIPYYGIISALYIGGQSAIDAVEKYRK